MAASHVMRIACKSVFVATLLLGWLIFAWFGDFNLYFFYPDGGSMIMEHATLAERVIFGFLIALVFAALDTLALWLWSGFRSRREKLSSVADAGQGKRT